MEDYYNERNVEIGKRLMLGESPRKLAREYNLKDVAVVEACLPLDYSYQSLKTTIRKRFAMGESITEMALSLNLSGALVKGMLNMSTAKSLRIIAICKMHDSGYSKTRIGKVTNLPIEDVDRVLTTMGRDVDSMPYYRAWGVSFPSNDSEEWHRKIFEYLLGDTLESYKLTIRNEIEKDFQKRARREYTRFIRNELEEAERIEDDYEYSRRLLKVLTLSKKSTKKEVVTQALIEYGRKIGFKRGGGKLGTTEDIKARIRYEQEMNEYAATIEEIGHLPLELVDDLMIQRYNKERRNADTEHRAFLPDYLKE